MKFNYFDWYSGSIAFSIVFFLFFLNLLSGDLLNWGLNSLSLGYNEYFIMDSVSWYLTMLTLLLGSILILIVRNVSNRCLILVLVSVISGVCCYNVSNCVLFWCFYEISILALLYLLIVESPYSERFVASWYLVGYVTFTSLPMLLVMLYFSGVSGSFNISMWVEDDLWSGYNLILWVFLGLLFITKIPLFPFHVWLPIVHAEANSIVSVCLSGFIMKLGLLGIYRFCSFVSVGLLFSEEYIILLMFMAVIYFLSACMELDGKRWLAFLSLSHITMAVVGIFLLTFESSSVVFAYSVGHGLSAGLVFVLLWWGYELIGSRNWNVLKFVLGSNGGFRSLTVLSLCTVASLPTSIQFFCEILLLMNTGKVSCIIFYCFCVYLFISSLIPFFMLGVLLSRRYSVSNSSFNGAYAYLYFTFFMGIWSFILFFVI